MSSSYWDSPVRRLDFEKVQQRIRNIELKLDRILERINKLENKYEKMDSTI